MPVPQLKKIGSNFSYENKSHQYAQKSCIKYSSCKCHFYTNRIKITKRVFHFHTLCMCILSFQIADQDNGEGKTVRYRVIVKKAVLDGSPTMLFVFNIKHLSILPNTLKKLSPTAIPYQHPSLLFHYCLLQLDMPSKINS